MEMTMKTVRGGGGSVKRKIFGLEKRRITHLPHCNRICKVGPGFKTRPGIWRLLSEQQRWRETNRFSLFYVLFIIWSMVNFFAAVLMLVDVCGQVASGWGYWEWETATDREGERESSLLLEVEYVAKAGRLKRPHKGIEYGPPEGISWLIEDQASLRSYDSAPPPPSSVKLDRRHTGLRDNFLTGEGGKRVGEEPNHMTESKLGPL